MSYPKLEMEKFNATDLLRLLRIVMNKAAPNGRIGLSGQLVQKHVEEDKSQNKETAC